METPQAAPPATPEMVWAILRELAADQRELAASQKETDRAIKEFTASNAASHREMEQARKETERVLKETGKRLGDFTNSFGEIVEYMVAPNLQDRFFDLGMDFQEVSKDIKIRDKKNGSDDRGINRRAERNGRRAEGNGSSAKGNGQAPRRFHE